MRNLVLPARRLWWSFGACLTAATLLGALPTAASAWDDSDAPAAEAPAPAETSEGAQSAASGASAGASDDATRSEAVRRYELGREHYLAGRYREALTELKAALALDPTSPNLAYNVARVNEDLGNLDEAISYYQRYLRLLPRSEAKERDRTEKTLRRLQGARDEVAAHRSEAELKGFGPSQTQPPARASFGRADLWFWVAAVGGVGLTAVGAATGLLALQRENDVADFVVGPDGSIDERKTLIRQADNYALTSDVCFIAGGTAIAGAALLFFLREPEDYDDDGSDTDTDVGFFVHPRGAALNVQARF